MIETIHANKIILLNLTGAWVSYMAAVALAIMPLFQLIALTFTIVASLLTIIKLCIEIPKLLFKTKNEKPNNNP
jgi:hypothetical protein